MAFMQNEEDGYLGHNQGSPRFQSTIPSTTIPEPSILTLLAVAFGAVLAFRLKLVRLEPSRRVYGLPQADTQLDTVRRDPRDISGAIGNRIRWGSINQNSAAPEPWYRLQSMRSVLLASAASQASVQRKSVR